MMRKTFSQLNELEELQDQDVLAVETESDTYKVTFATLKKLVQTSGGKVDEATLKTLIGDAVKNKVDAEEGKTLTDVNFTKDYENKLKQLSNYDDSTLKKSIKDLNNSLTQSKKDLAKTSTELFPEDITASVEGEKVDAIIYTTKSSIVITKNTTKTTLQVKDGVRTLDLTGVTTLDLHSCGITKIEFINSGSITKLLIYDNSLENLDVSPLKGLQYLHMHNNPICEDADALSDCLVTLPDRNNMAIGSILVSNQTIRKQVEHIAITKDWYFGSLLQYDTTALGKMDYLIKNSGILDIWESAEYGEGSTIVILDCGFSPNLKNVPKSEWLKFYNASTQKSSTTDPVPPSTYKSIPDNQRYHGNMSLCVARGNGTTWYGVAPKCAIIPVKVADATNSPTGPFVQKGLEYVVNTKDSGINIISMSFANSLRDHSESIITHKIKDLIYDCIYNKNIAFVSGCPNGEDNAQSGEASETGVSIPINIKDCFTVGCCDSSNAVVNFVSPTKGLSALFYGKGIKYELKPNTLTTGSGSSQSTAGVNGLIALVNVMLTKKYGRQASIKEIQDFILHRTVPIANKDVDHVGNGYIQLMSYNSNVKTPNYTLDLEVEQ